MADYPVVIIDEDGHLLAEGRAATRRLSGRAGRWRMLTSSPRLIVLTRDEASEGAEANPVPRVALSGEIDAAGGLFDLIGFLHQTQWSGALHTIDGPAHRTIWFKRGDVRTSGSNLPADRLGELLYRYGRITREELDRALLKVGPSHRLGQALVDLGVVSSHDVFTFIRKQVEEVFFAVLRLRTGSFYFERSSGDEKLPDLALSTHKLLLDGARRMDEMHYFREKIPDSDSVPAQRQGGPSLPPADEHERTVLSLVDGHRSVDEIGRESKLGEFDATRALFQLAQAGYVEIRLEWDVSRSGLSRPDVTAARAGLVRLIDVFNELLAKIHATLAASNKAERFRADLGAFFRGATAYTELFASVEPGANGHLPADRLLANLDQAQVSDRAQYLHQGLNELLFFLVFTVGESIGRDEEQELSRRLNEILKELGAQPA
ncbi:MAG TPA: DUF4388 domain-containing protein [Polyangia bacterium]|nr:DUF4388 domain-containing protein [Polyangia bacterium]